MKGAASLVAGGLLIAAALAAPWLGGAQTTLPHALWWLGGALAAAFFIAVFGRLAAGRPIGIPPLAGIAALFLLGCLGWWATQPEPYFATAFGASHWTFLQQRHPHSMVLLPRGERLGYFACVILGFLSAISLGRKDDFHKALALAIGCSGMAVAVYAGGLAHLGWPALSWALNDGGPERFNVCFSHHNSPPACLNLAWPLLVFGASGRFAWLCRIVPLVLVAIALPLSENDAGVLIAGGLLLGGLLWRWIALRGWLTPGRVRLVLGGVFVVILAGQGVLVSRMHKNAPDGWVSAEDSLLRSSARDAGLSALADQRGDRLVPSPRSDRPAGWLAAARMAADHPLIGAGPGAWVTRSALYSPDPLVNTFYLCRLFAHHDFLQWAAEWGGLAALAALVLFAGGLFRAAGRDAAPLGIVLALLGIALHSTVDSPLQNPALQLWTALLLGLAGSEIRKSET